MKAITWLATFATILGVSINNVLHFWGGSSFWIRFFFVVALLAAVVLAIIDIRVWRSSKAKHHKNAKSVNEYMLHLLKRGGSAAIFAHHLSWISDAPEIHQFVTSEAGKGRDFCIFVPRHNDLTRRLSTQGVTIKTYESLGYEPSARFTLLNPKESGSSLLAIGEGIFPDFYIEEFSDKTHSRVIAVVRDLLNILEEVSSRAHA